MAHHAILMMERWVFRQMPQTQLREPLSRRLMMMGVPPEDALDKEEHLFCWLVPGGKDYGFFIKNGSKVGKVWGTATKIPRRAMATPILIDIEMLAKPVAIVIMNLSRAIEIAIEHDVPLPPPGATKWQPVRAVIQS